MFGYETTGFMNKNGKPFFYNSGKTSKKAAQIEGLINRHSFLTKYSEPEREINEGIIGECYNQTIGNQKKAYSFLLKHPDLTEDNLQSLYEILSENQLEGTSKIEKNGKYRQKGVKLIETIYPYGFKVESGKGLDPSLVPKCMEDLFKFLNKKDIDPFIKAQIAHFYFVFVHPYYDVNGRTARTLSIWSLIKSNKNPHTIINRGICFNKDSYLESIRKSLKGDITPFLDFSLDTVKYELQMQIELHSLRKKFNLTNEESETLELILRSPKKTLPRLYHMFRFQKGIQEKKIVVQKLVQLLQKNVVSYNKETKEITILDIEEKNKVFWRSHGSGKNR